MNSVEPIAIVGTGCVLPGGLSTSALWETVFNGDIKISMPSEGDWQVDLAKVINEKSANYIPDHAWTALGGYVKDFKLNLDQFELDAALLEQLDPVFKWSLHAAAEAMGQIKLAKNLKQKAQVILGNLSYPTRLFNRYAEQCLFKEITGYAALNPVHPYNRFMSGAPAALIAKAFGFGGKAFALDAACASSLYAIKLACDELQAGQADLALAGGINASDQLFLHVGFSALHALSRTGQSRPFHRDANGLIPAEGAAFVALKRLNDAIKAGDNILGVIRGIGLSNDGRAGSLLTPSIEGQVRCMQQAYQQAGMDPKEVSWVECHATGTINGDTTELASMQQVFTNNKDMPIGSLKANLGHLITASGAAGLIKVLGCMQRNLLPLTPNAFPISDKLSQSPFRILKDNESWQADRQIAAVSSFGFGGNNAHLIVEKWRENYPVNKTARSKKPAKQKIAVVAMGIRTHLHTNLGEFTDFLLGREPVIRSADELTHLNFAKEDLQFPPNDLKKSLGQQLLLLKVAQETVKQAKSLAKNTGVYIGMEADPEVSRYGLRARLAEMLAQHPLNYTEDWFDAVRENIAAPLEAASVIGTMPNIPANRINYQFDLTGPGYTVANEELSGDEALQLAIQALTRGEITNAIVGAVDLSREKVHQTAAKALLGYEQVADVAVVLVLKPLEVAQKQGERIIAVFDAQGAASAYSLNAQQQSMITQKLGYAHAANGLLHMAAAIILAAHRCKLDEKQHVQPVLRSAAGLPGFKVFNQTFTGRQNAIKIYPGEQAFAVYPALKIYTYAAEDRISLQARLKQNEPSNLGSHRLALVCRPEQLAEFRERAIALLAQNQSLSAWSMQGIIYRSAPVEGELAFVFTGSAAAYAGMGKELLLGLPQLAATFTEQLADPAAAIAWAYNSSSSTNRSAYDQLCGSSFICQLHGQFSRHVLGLKPQAVLGLSSGETNSLYAMGVWHGIDQLLGDIKTSQLYEQELAGEFNSVKRYWQLPPEQVVNWTNWRILAPVVQIQALIADEKHVYISIINSANDCVIGGDDAACKRILSHFAPGNGLSMEHDLAIHCAPVQAFETTWRQLHTRPVQNLSGVRFYSNYFGKSYALSEKNVADALTGQAIEPINFPRTIEQAWQDGVRIFLEHGPRNSLSTAIKTILQDKPHLAISLDIARKSSLEQAYIAAAELWCAGVQVDLAKLEEQAPSPFYLASQCSTQASVSLPLRMPAIKANPLPTEVKAQVMKKAPAKPDFIFSPIAGQSIIQLKPVSKRLIKQLPSQQPQVLVKQTNPQPSATHAISLIQQTYARLNQVHQQFLQSQLQVQQSYMLRTRRVQQMLTKQLATGTYAGNTAAPTETVMPLLTTIEPASLFKSSHSKVNEAQVEPSQPEQLKLPNIQSNIYPGPAFSREQLEILASGQISAVFGPLFCEQDKYAVQVRMPEPPLLLCDRVLGIKGEACSLGLGTIWTETDVKADSWYLHNGRMPAGIFIESGQADLLLISWLGIDFHNRGERAYRLLGCELTFYDELPQVGETLHYDIHVDGHAQQGDIRLFFFHYDCHINGKKRIEVRNGQAGFFTAQELAESMGVLWDPATAHYVTSARLDIPKQASTKQRFSVTEVDAYTQGNITNCFGECFGIAHTHTRTPRSQAGKMNFLREVTEFNPHGGPAGRGYLRAESKVSADDWYFKGHFKNDPCMPGTLMAEACLQAMSFYLTALGYTLDKDGWRFEPVTNERYKFVCRGQVLPTSQHLTYEVFVDEIVAEPYPTLYAHVLATVDGLKAFQCERLGLRLVPDWPLASMHERVAKIRESDASDLRPVAKIGDFTFNYESLLSCAWGKPSKAFSERFNRYDGIIRSPRLPGPPYHFMTRVTELKGEFGIPHDGSFVVVDYDIPADAWYFQENDSASMPYCVLMEAALQPCGWLSSFTIENTGVAKELLYRNLDGWAVQHSEITPQDSVLTTRSILLSTAKMGDIIIQKFKVECYTGARKVYSLTTAFGFFTKEAMQDQKGLAFTVAEKEQLTTESNFYLDLTTYPIAYFNPQMARLPISKLLMLDRIVYLNQKGGEHGKGYLRAEKDTVLSDWFFKAHFFQDPVQPGSLGVQALIQALQFFLLQQHATKLTSGSRFEPILLEEEIKWHYRGQVTPDKEKIVVEIEITEEINNGHEIRVIAKGKLWCNRLKIYQVPKLGMKLLLHETR